MKRMLLLTLAVAAAISLVAVMGVRSLGGSGGVASAAAPGLYLDLVEDTGWCNTIDSASTVLVGATHKAAICLVGQNPGNAPSDFDVVVNFNTAVDSCTNTGQSGNAIDANPDMVAIGTGWNCSLGGLKYPYCGENNNEVPPVVTSEAFITCGTTTDPGVLSGPEAIAIITWTATAVGVDNLTFGIASLSDYPGDTILTCPSASCNGATVTKEVPPTPTPPAAECDIGCVGAPGGVVANPSALSMKVGDPAQIVDLTATFQNYGAVTQGAPDATCSFAIAMGSGIFVSNPPLTTLAVDPTKLAVRMVPSPRVGALPGDVCLSCTPSQGTKSVGDCLDPTKGATGPFDPNCYPVMLPSCNPLLWTYMPVSCQEGGYNPAVPFETSGLVDGGCRDGIDNNADTVIDWRGFSAAPDPACVDVQAVGLIPALRTVLAPDATAVKTRQIEIQCLARGLYPVFVFAGDSQAAQSPATNPSASDPNGANNSCGSVLMVNCTQGPEMVKDCDPLTEGIQDTCTLWIMDPEFAGGVEAGTDPPVTLPPADDNGCVLPEMGKGCLAIDVWLTSAADEDNINDSDLIPECLGAWEHQVRFDHKLFRIESEFDPDGWLESEGRIANCTISVLGEDWILEGCVTKDDPAEPGMQLGPCGSGIIERMLLIPNTNDLMYRGVFRPTKNNGLATNIVDDNCEITDIYGEPMADTLPGQLTPVCGDLHITIRMLEGDTDLDCDVDVIDDAAVAMRYGSIWGMALYNQWFDLEGPNLSLPDGDIDVKDIQFVFGRNYSTCQDPIPDDQDDPVDPAQP